jgi:hypothetical protein
MLDFVCLQTAVRVLGSVFVWGGGAGGGGDETPQRLCWGQGSLDLAGEGLLLKVPPKLYET